MTTSNLNRRLKSLEAGNGGIQMIIGDEDFLAREQERLKTESVPGVKYFFIIDEFGCAPSCNQQGSCSGEESL